MYEKSWIRTNKNPRRIIIILSVAFIIFISLAVIKGVKSLKGTMEVQGDKVKAFTLKTGDRNTFKDTITVYITEEDKIIELPIEEYVMGVLSSEMPISFELEALKAQAVAARTYAFGKTLGGCANGKGADICDTVHCQVYKSKEKVQEAWAENKAEEYYDKLTRAVRDTEGQILTFKGELVRSALYFSTSWGKTENSEEVFSGRVPYLKSVESPGEEISNRYSSKESISIATFVSSVNQMYPSAELTEKQLQKQVEILSRNSGGSVKEIRLGNTKIRGRDFRSLFSLNSANFSLDISKDKVDISCLGYGHGVGMSQWGANVMAKAGKNHIEILTHYYSGVKVETIK